MENEMNWQPIEVYDAMPTKPRYAVFAIAGTKPARGQRSEYGLPPAVVQQRNYGCRVVTHFIELPPLPAPEGATP
jgi:hypothetical protein